MLENLIYSLILGSLIAAVIWLNVAVRRDPEWSRCLVWRFWRPTKLIDGSTLRFGEAMRRYVDGRYQYRRETADEYEDRRAAGYW